MEKQRNVDENMATAAVATDQEQGQELQANVLGTLSTSKGLQKALSKILKSTQGLGFDWANKVWRDVLAQFGLIDKAEKTLYWITWVGLRTLCRLAWKCHVYGEMFPEYGAGIVVGNHVSHVDPFFISQAVHRRVLWMSKDENFETPIITSIFRNYGAFPVARGQHDEEAMNHAKQVITNGDWLGMFPEGTRSLTADLLPFHTGAVRLAIEMQVPIVPVITAGIRKVLPKGSLFIKVGTPISIMVGKAIYYEEYYGKTPTYNNLQNLTDELQTIVYEMRKELNDIHGLRDGSTLRDTEQQLSIGYPKAKD
ncbi:MAG TPA: lysophospholipid acyltransferase family protein [Candidatus Lokiarchaeia archaeon]|nr:lysophospholipid acyltransferase family protein [Candidatus Lokiarchaeia archaeon]